MLTKYQIESELSLAYLYAVSAYTSFSVDVPHIDSDSVDAIICAKGKIAVDSILHSPRIDVQLKSTINATPNDKGEIPFSLDIKNYDDLRVDTVVPRILVLLSLPRDNAEWLLHHPDKLVMQRCAYYVSLKGCPASTNEKSQTVYLPLVNELSPTALRNLMIKVSKGEDL